VLSKTLKIMDNGRLYKETQFQLARKVGARARNLTLSPGEWRLIAVYTVISYAKALDAGGFALRHSNHRMRFRLWSQIALVCLATCSLTVSLATRFFVASSESPNTRSVQNHSPDAQRQQLLGDGLKWSAPPSSFTFFQPPRPSVYAVSAVFPSTNLCSESWLYNRPPPIG
jgi:hypothetical protein